MSAFSIGLRSCNALRVFSLPKFCTRKLFTYSSSLFFTMLSAFITAADKVSRTTIKSPFSVCRVRLPGRAVLRGSSELLIPSIAEPIKKPISPPIGPVSTQVKPPNIHFHFPIYQYFKLLMKFSACSINE